MFEQPIIFLATVAVGIVLGVAWKHWRKNRVQALRSQAVDQFTAERPALGEVLRSAADATGKPRGLSWVRCELGDDQAFAIDRASGALYALVGTTISFAAIPGGGMEDVEAVGNLRYGTGMFVYREGQWRCDGQVAFNLNPAQTLEHYSASLSPWSAT